MSVKLFSNLVVYLKSEIDALLAGKSDTDHTHAGGSGDAIIAIRRAWMGI